MKVSDTLTTVNELVLPNDTNPLGNLMGGRLLHWMDIAAAISAQKLARNICVTAAVNNVSFSQPIKLGNVVTLESKVVRTFHTSMEVHIQVWSQNFSTGTSYKCNEAYYTFVAISDIGRPLPVPEVEPETDEEKHLYAQAQIRRQLKLLMAGKISLDKAPELKATMHRWMEEGNMQIP
ncbi:MAG: acyl-CoA thioesterase [Bacteroidia bacterium]